MSMETHAMNIPMTPDDAFAVTLLVTCEITKNVLLDRCSRGSIDRRTLEKRIYYLERMCKDIEGLNATYPGYLPDNFQNTAKKYHKMVEVDINNLLKAYKGESA
jgi:hypothetical protein